MPAKLHLQPAWWAKTSTPGIAHEKLGTGDPPVEAIGEATQSERDQILSQVLPLWQRPAGLVVGAHTTVRLRVLVLADGTLGPPFAAGAAWNPARAIVNYAAMPPGDPWRKALENLYLALRLAQPLKLPPALLAKAPVTAILDFRVADVP